jgi:hypothetical protein
MAIVTLTGVNEGSSQYITWAALANGDTGQPLENASRYADKTVQIFGTFGASGSVTLQGSNDPRAITDPSNAVWFTLVDPGSNAITKTSAAGEAILENPRFIRPTVTAGDGTTALTVVIASRGA